MTRSAAKRTAVAGRLLRSVVLVAAASAVVADASDLLPVPSFAAPPAVFRPKFRYWLPDASVSAAALDADIAELAAAGAGGLELLPFYNYGQPPVSTDWSVYGFGTPAFAALFRAALNSTAQHAGMVLDFALGANQGAGVPSRAPPSSLSSPSSTNSTDRYLEDCAGLAMELVYGTAPLAAGESLHGRPLPRPAVHFNYEPLQGFINAPELWGGSALVAVLAVEVTEERPPTRDGHRLVLLNETSVADLTDRVDKTTGTLMMTRATDDWTVPSGAGNNNSSWQLMAFYQRYTNERSCVSVANATTWLGNGSWMVDHFSAAGAQKMTRFWDAHLLADNTTKALLRKVGEYSWEDSLEMMASLWWTPGFLQQFQQARGYSAVRSLPVLFQAKNLWNSYGAPYNTTYAFDETAPDGGQYAEDYRLTLNEGYQAFLRHYQTWAAGHGLQHSCQPAYNLPLDMAADIPLVGAPELESLGFSESVENYLQFTGAAHVAGRTTVSTEIGAQRIGAYAQTVPALLWLVRDSFAAGVNTLVVHGYPYSGTYPGTTWPGYTPFQFEFGEMWGPRQPAWRHINDTLLFAARTTLVLKTGVPRVDVAFYAWAVPFSARGARTGPEELNAAGYTHEYIGPENLVLARSNASNGVLCPDGPAYKALVIEDDHQQRITPAASAALLAMAAANLPIFVVQTSSPKSMPFNASATAIGMTGQAAVTANLQALLNGSFPSVRTVSSRAAITADLLAAGERGTEPRVRVLGVSGGEAQNASQLYTHWRSDVANKKEFVYVLNRGPAGTFALSLAVPSNRSWTAFVLDAWTGEQTPLLVYTRTADGRRVMTNVTLAQEQSTLLAFVEEGNSTEGASTGFHVVGHSPNIGRIRPDKNGRLEVLVRDGTPASLRLSNGSTVVIAAPPGHNHTPSTNSAAAPVDYTLGPWALSVESYAAPTTLTTASVTANKTTITIPSPLTTLRPWTQIPGLERVSGVGTYVTTFRLPAANTSTSTIASSSSSSHRDAPLAYTLHLTGRIAHTLRAFVNGVPVPAFDPAASTKDNDASHRGGRDISALLRAPGLDNEIRIETASSLFNAVKARAGDVRSIGLGTRVPRYYTEGDWAAFGLVGDVYVQPWRRVVLA
ncbi:hypothetical protein SPI_01382 [Niveomyces insectorum RCEF 264]|uniref:Secreted protein n=1 Tax=Niveomyces insectorum RCEF 264 TaxID=1081102 RepID=A0A167YX96_9HYPO|nr:hypothetical protein SPI_01382 [Niveomyces insectorum RCEF 264]